MENGNGLMVHADLTHADGYGERKPALEMINRHSPGSTRRPTLAADKGYDSRDVVSDLRRMVLGAETIPRIVSKGPPPAHRTDCRVPEVADCGRFWAGIWRSIRCLSVSRSFVVTVFRGCWRRSASKSDGSAMRGGSGSRCACSMG